MLSSLSAAPEERPADAGTFRIELCRLVPSAAAGHPSLAVAAARSDRGRCGHGARGSKCRERDDRGPSCRHGRRPLRGSSSSISRLRRCAGRWIRRLRRLLPSLPRGRCRSGAQQWRCKFSVPRCACRLRSPRVSCLWSSADASPRLLLLREAGGHRWGGRSRPHGRRRGSRPRYVAGALEIVRDARGAYRV